MEHKTEKENLPNTEAFAEAHEEEQTEAQTEVTPEERKQGLKLSIAAILIVLLAFVIITVTTDWVGSVLGKTTETGILILIAGALAAVLIRDRKNK